MRATVYMECGAFYRADGPAAMRPVGETEFVTGVAAMGDSGLYGAARACAGDRRPRRPDAGRGGRARCWRRTSPPAAAASAASATAPSCDADPEVLGPLAAGRRASISTPPSARASRGSRRWAFPSTPGCWSRSCRDLIDLARAFPRRAIILDHVGTPLGIGAYAGRRDERFAIWRDNIRALAELPNVAVKLGGLAMAFRAFPSLLAEPPAAVGAARRRVAALHRDLHRGVRPEALHVREQLPGRSRQLRLSRAVERLQAHRRRLFGRREDAPVQRHGARDLPPAAGERHALRRTEDQPGPS